MAAINRIPLIDRILYDAETGCWNWRGAKSRRGYGMAFYKGHFISAHRFAAHLWLRMALDDERQVLHHCDNPSCFNPKHLFIGTRSDNIRDCVQKKRHGSSKKTHCPLGHPYGVSYKTKTGFRRVCRECPRRRARDYAKRKKAEVKP